MHFENTIPITNQATARQATLSFFSNLGFQCSSDDTLNSLQFQRGSLLNNFITFDPLKWKSSITVQFTDNEAKIKCEVTTTGQVTQENEVNLWKAFLNRYETYLTTENPTIIEENKVHTSEVKQSVYVKIGIGLASIIGYQTIFYFFQNSLYSFLFVLITLGIYYSIQRK